MMFDTSANVAMATSNSRTNRFEQKYENYFRAIGMDVKGQPEAQKKPQHQHRKMSFAMHNNNNNNNNLNNSIDPVNHEIDDISTSHVKEDKILQAYNRQKNKKKTIKMIKQQSLTKPRVNCLFSICTNKHPFLMIILVFLIASLMVSSGGFLDAIITQILDNSILVQQKYEAKATRFGRLILVKFGLIILLYVYITKGIHVHSYNSSMRETSFKNESKYPNYNSFEESEEQFFEDEM